jgi:hypothetical protein
MPVNMTDGSRHLGKTLTTSRTVMTLCRPTESDFLSSQQRMVVTPPGATAGAVFLLVGGLVLVGGLAVRRGHCWLLSGYDPARDLDEGRVARVAGRSMVGVGAVTMALGVGFRTGTVRPWLRIAFLGWTTATVVLTLLAEAAARGYV